MRETETVFRKPFTPEELKAITDATKDDDFIRPTNVTGMCTAIFHRDEVLPEGRTNEEEVPLIESGAVRSGIGAATAGKNGEFTK